ncbi:MAG: hypothetical protein ACOY3N_23470 [Bradyrhizobium sp.]|uniref:hypothetical protein n=1 Tax=Bradyrhizobium sp. TaxID=376 RepID=UPI003BF14A46
MIGRVFFYARERRARHEATVDLIVNALGLLDVQRRVAVATFGANDPHLDELADERAGLIAQAHDLGMTVTDCNGAAWA